MKLHTAWTIENRFSEAGSLTAAVGGLANPNGIRLLTEADKAAVLRFLAVRPVHTIVMRGFISDNGIESENNRGKFYGYRNERGALEAVALIGHTTLIESRSATSLSALASVARTSKTPIHIMMSDGKTVETFWKSYAGDRRAPRLTCTELLFEMSFPFVTQECSWNVRLAKPEELEKVALAHAEVAFAESGIDPMVKDRAGFLKRTLRRIEKNRTFVVFDGDKLVFKADIVAETVDVIYLEGIFVAPEFRGRGIASGCLSKLATKLLTRVENICLLSNVEFKAAHRSFLKAGFKNTDRSTTIFV